MNRISLNAISRTGIAFLLLWCLSCKTATMQPNEVDNNIALLNDSSLDVREKATDRLVKIGVPAIESLVAALKGENENIRHGAGQALIRIGTPAVEPLKKALKDSDEGVREVVARLLEEMGAK